MQQNKEIFIQKMKRQHRHKTGYLTVSFWPQSWKSYCEVQVYYPSNINCYWTHQFSQENADVLHYWRDEKGKSEEMIERNCSCITVAKHFVERYVQECDGCVDILDVTMPVPNGFFDACSFTSNVKYGTIKNCEGSQKTEELFSSLKCFFDSLEVQSDESLIPIGENLWLKSSERLFAQMTGITDQEIKLFTGTELDLSSEKLSDARIRNLISDIIQNKKCVKYTLRNPNCPGFSTENICIGFNILKDSEVFQDGKKIRFLELTTGSSTTVVRITASKEVVKIESFQKTLFERAKSWIISKSCFASRHSPTACPTVEHRTNSLSPSQTQSNTAETQPNSVPQSSTQTSQPLDDLLPQGVEELCIRFTSEKFRFEIGNVIEYFCQKSESVVRHIKKVRNEVVITELIESSSYEELGKSLLKYYLNDHEHNGQYLIGTFRFTGDIHDVDKLFENLPLRIEKVVFDNRSMDRELLANFLRNVNRFVKLQYLEMEHPFLWRAIIFQARFAQNVQFAVRTININILFLQNKKFVINTESFDPWAINMFLMAILVGRLQVNYFTFRIDKFRPSFNDDLPSDFLNEVGEILDCIDARNTVEEETVEEPDKCSLLLVGLLFDINISITRERLTGYVLC